MALSLRTRLTLILGIVNGGVFGALTYWVASDDSRVRVLDDAFRTRLYEQFTSHFSDLSNPEISPNIAGVLTWPHWTDYSDAMVLDDRFVRLENQIVPGAILFPNGSRRRSPAASLEAQKDAVYEAIQRTGPSQAADGLAMPLAVGPNRRQIWGGVFVRFPETETPQPFALVILLASGAATLVAGGLIYAFLGRLVVRPVEELAGAVESFELGSERIVLPEAARGSKEIDALLHSLQHMMRRIRGFQVELEREVTAATDRAQSAERHAARQDRLAAMGTLAAGLAHEINSPLAGALQGLQTLKKDAASERSKKYGELTQEALTRIQFLVQRLLKLAPARVEPGACRIADVLNDLPTFLESRLRNHDFKVELPGSELWVNGSTGDLFPVLLNLLNNSLDALDEQYPQGGGEIGVFAEVREERGYGVRLRILDNGPGVPQEQIANIFEPFVTNKDVGKGTGLGLALAYATVRQLGGDVEAANRVEGGFVITLWLATPKSDS